MDAISADIVLGVVAIVSPLVIGGFAFTMLKYFPSRKEFEAHEARDNERFIEVKEWKTEFLTTLRDAKTDIIREVKNGYNGNNRN